ncbi:MAG: hypothetical protein WAT84_03005 [Candidatus Moraniibacteriota bacterium]
MLVLRFFLGVAVFVTALLSASVYSTLAAKAAPPEMTVAKFVELSRKTEAECQEMMDRMKSGERPQMTVADCVERTGKTESECQTMMSKMKEGGPGEGGMRQDGMKPAAVGGQPAVRSELRSSTQGRAAPDVVAEALPERAKRQMAVRARSYDVVEARSKKFIEYLQGEGATTTEIEGFLVTFRSKADATLAAFDTYIAALKTWESDKSETNTAAVATAKTVLKAASTETSSYVRETLVPALRTLIDTVNE